VLDTVLLLGGCLLAGGLAYRLPHYWVRRRIKQRSLIFQTRLVDLTLGLSNGLRSGAALPQTLELVARDIGGPVGEEFSLLLQEYHLGVDLPEGLNRLCRRMPGEDLNLLVTAVRLTMQSGGSLADVLDKITDTIRQRTEFYERLKTMTAQGRFEAVAMALAPMVAFIVLYMIDSDLMSPLVTTQIGWLAIGVVVTLEVIGFFFINRIVNVEV
jgi:tight adherence protein B